jgi:hypothetical protein
LDNPENIAFLKKYGLYNFAVTATDLFYKYFLNKDIENETADELMELVFEKGNFGVKEEKVDYTDVILASDKCFIVKYFTYFKKRALLTWPITVKHKFLSNFGIVYIPLRYIFRRIFGKKEKIDLKKVKSVSSETNYVYSQLHIFEKNN